MITSKNKSLVKYIGRTRKEVKGSKLKLKPTIGLCPCGCGTELQLHVEKLVKAVPPFIYKGRFYVYICPKCESRWTSTESDSISIATLKPKKK